MKTLIIGFEGTDTPEKKFLNENDNNSVSESVMDLNFWIKESDLIIIKGTGKIAPYIAYAALVARNMEKKVVVI